MRRFTFKTKGEADAFVEGVEYVNDSAITIGRRGTRRDSTSFTQASTAHFVEVHDGDASADAAEDDDEGDEP